MLKFAALALAAALALPLAAAPALAATVTREVEVDARLHSSNTLNGLATGLTVQSGGILKVSAGSSDTWTLGGNTPCTRTSNADGLTCYGTYTQGGLSARFGSLVGRIGNGSVFGAFFVIGTEFERAVADTGLLYLYAWDSFAGDNSGTIRVTVSTVPLPAGGLMLMGALTALGALRRRKTSQNPA